MAAWRHGGMEEASWVFGGQTRSGPIKADQGPCITGRVPYWELFGSLRTLVLSAPHRAAIFRLFSGYFQARAYTTLVKGLIGKFPVVVKCPCLVVVGAHALVEESRGWRAHIHLGVRG